MAGARHPVFAAASAQVLRLLYFNAGFRTQKRLRAILQAAGFELVFGPLTRPRPNDAVVVWGKSPTAHRGEQYAARHNLPLLRVEDAFVRSVCLGRAGDPPIGLLLDPVGVHFDAARPSQLEQILAKDPLDDTQLLARAKAGMARLRALDISKYNTHDQRVTPPQAGYVLVVDQTRGDASIAHSGADAARFAQMLEAARSDFPHARILIKTHPETAQGYRAGHFGPADCDAQVQLLQENLSPHAALDGAIAVYTVSSQLGLEAIFAGHRPKLFGLPFYAGWGLTDDQTAAARRGRKLTKAQLFAAAYLMAPLWFCPYRQRLCSFEEAIDTLEAQLRARREDSAGYVAGGMRAWKRARLQAVFGSVKPLIFKRDIAAAVVHAQNTGRKLMVWGMADTQPDLAVLRLEDGLLRSRGLGAALTPPLSLILDDIGLYYDPSRPSRFEALMMQPLPPDARVRAQVLVDGLRAARLSKYNLGGAAFDLPKQAQGRTIVLVVGQVVDDASVRLGAGGRSNMDLLRASRAAYPQGFILYKPHPDVEAGLRLGAVAAQDLAGLADLVASQTDPMALLDKIDVLVTLTSTYGFEALLRGVPVTTLGAPFYAGWGLTRDLGDVPQRRKDHLRALDQQGLPAPDLLHLAHAALIAYPRYFDPITKTPCPPEVALLRLAQAQGAGPALPQGLGLRLLSKLQGHFASYAHWWR